MGLAEISGVIKKRKVQWALVAIIFIIVLFWSSSIRLSNWSLLTDQTTGEKIPLALDPFYFLRLSETILKNGSLPGVDVMRYPAAHTGFTPEILPQVTVLIFKIANIFGDYSIQEVNVFSPVLFYFIGLILFFILTYVLTKSKWTSLISSAFLAFIPSYVYRTTAGFSDHESLGMMAFFSALIVFVLALKYLDKHRNLKRVGLYALATAFLTTFAVASWGGVANFLFMIFPTSFLILWLIKIRNERDFITRGLLFYLTWIVFTVLFGFIFGYSPGIILMRFVLGTAGLISFFVLIFILADFLLIKYQKKIRFLNDKNREIYAVVSLIVLGILGLSIAGLNVFSIISEIWTRLFHPWGVDRIGLTVAENAQPYLVDWIGTSGTFVFWMFFGGIVLLGLKILEQIKNKERTFLAGVFWLILISSILFSRISTGSLMNGTNFLSQVVYVGGIVLPLIFFFWLYFKENVVLKPEIIFLISWMSFSLIAGRAAQRMFFAITPVVCFFAAYLLLSLWNYSKKINKKIFRIFLIGLLIIGIFGGALSIYNEEKALSAQVKTTGPSAHYQWQKQKAMAWVRDNTPEGSIFVHWWDYGYWVEYLGERPSVTDGGHAIGYWDHLVGRYLLTTPNPETAYSFMKTHDVSYLLIDPTDIGKYSAYGRIGSDSEGFDRYSAIPVIPMDKSRTVSSNGETAMVYSGGYLLDEDITYRIGDKVITLPFNDAGVAGVIWKKVDSSVGGASQLEQPIGVYIYNGQRYDLPIRYVYLKGEIMDFGSGVGAIIRPVTSFDGSSLQELGAIMYLSPKVSNSLFAQLYLLDDVFGNYEYLTLVQSSGDYVVDSLKSQGAPVEDFLYYGGLRGPIKIWKVDYPKGTLVREEFLRTSGGWAEFDNLQFTA